MEEYYLSVAAIGKFEKLPISQSDYHKIIEAKITLQCATSLERKYEIIIRNYHDFEKALLNVTLGKMLSRPFAYKDASERMLEMNTRIMNLLSSSRS